MDISTIGVIIASIAAIISCFIEWETKKPNEGLKDVRRRTNRNVYGRLLITMLVIAGLLVTFLQGIREGRETRLWQNKADSLQRLVVDFSTRGTYPVNPVDLCISYTYKLRMDEVKESFPDFDPEYTYTHGINRYKKITQDVYFKGWEITLTPPNLGDSEYASDSVANLIGTEVPISQGEIDIEKDSATNTCTVFIRLVIRKTQFDLFMSNNKDLLGYEILFHATHSTLDQASLCITLGAGSNFATFLSISPELKTNAGHGLTTSITPKDFTNCKCSEDYSFD